MNMTPIFGEEKIFENSGIPVNFNGKKGFLKGYFRRKKGFKSEKKGFSSPINIALTLF